MDFGHLLQREWVLKPRTTFDGLIPYRLSEDILAQIDPNDIVAGFIHRGCLVLACYKGRWHEAANRRPIQDWFCRQVITLCTLLWCAANGRIWLRVENPAHVYVQFNVPHKYDRLDDGQFDDVKTDVGTLSQLIRSVSSLSRTEFVARVSYAILWRVNSVIQRTVVLPDGKRMLQTFVHAFTAFDRNRNKVFPLRESLRRLLAVGPYNLVLMQFTHAGKVIVSDSDTDSKEALALYTHYAGAELIRFWGMDHMAEFRRVAVQYSVMYRKNVEGWQEDFVRWAFEGRVGLDRSIRTVMHMLMLASGSPPTGLTRILLDGEVKCHRINRAPGRCPITDPRRVLLLGLFDGSDAKTILHHPSIRCGLYAFTRDAIENQVNVLDGTRWRSAHVTEKLLDEIDTALALHKRFRLPASKIDDACILFLSKRSRRVS